MIRRALATTVLAAALIAGGTGVASATDNPNRHPDITEQLQCGPGYYDGYSYCKPEKLLEVPHHAKLKKSADHWWNPFSWFA